MNKWFLCLSLLLALPGTQAQPTSDDLDRYFFAAARLGDTEVLQTFLQHGYPVNARNEQSYTALMIATYAGQLPAVQLLLEHGADRCIRDKRGHTAMMGAVVKAEWRIARTLYRTDCDDSDNEAGVTLDEFAEVFGQTERLASLRAELGIEPAVQ